MYEESVAAEEGFGATSFFLVLFFSLFVCLMLSFCVGSASEDGVRQPIRMDGSIFGTVVFVDGHLCIEYPWSDVVAHHPDCPCKLPSRSALVRGWDLGVD